ncbi:MAG: restriction endonuclease, SacI family [Planctomycetales bacterium]
MKRPSAWWGRYSVRHKGEGYEIVVHPANQPGTSSNEVGDIDVRLGDALELPVEVKDKSFGMSDVDHAVHKARNAGCPRLLFVMGRQAVGEGVDFAGLTAAQAQQGFDLAFTTVDAIVKSEVALLGETDRRSLVQKIDCSLTAMRAKDETRRHFTATLEAAGFIG